jgi:hypothetical protein
MYKAAVVEKVLKSLADPVTLLCTPSLIVQWKDSLRTREHIWRTFRSGAQKLLTPTIRKSRSPFFFPWFVLLCVNWILVMSNK